jgi:hypothetical protein
VSRVYNFLASVFEALYWRRQPRSHPQQERPPFWTFVRVNMRARCNE